MDTAPCRIFDIDMFIPPPDKLLLSQKVHSREPTQFSLDTIIYSLSQRMKVASADSVCVWYDYEQLKKCEAPREMEAVLEELQETGKKSVE